MSFQTRFRERRETLGLSRAELAKRLGITTAAIGNYETGVSTPKADILFAVFDALHCDANYLFQDEMRESVEVNCDTWAAPIIAAYRSTDESTQRAACAVLGINRVVPLGAQGAMMRKKCSMILFEYPAAAGLPLYAESDFERIEVLEEDVPAGADFGIKISGDSMAPTIEDGSIVWVRKQNTIRHAEVGIFMLGDSAVCKRVSLDRYGRIEKLVSDNKEHGDITGDDLEEARVVGKVLGID